MRYSVFVVAAVAMLQKDGTGTRRVLLKDGTLLEFSRQPTILDELPPEVAADEYLVKEPIGEAPVEVVAPPATVPDDLSKLPWPGLVRLAKGLGIATQGKNRKALEALVKASLDAQLAEMVAAAQVTIQTPPSDLTNQDPGGD